MGDMHMPPSFVESALSATFSSPVECDFSSVVRDSREAAPGALFFALSGERFDGTDFLPAVAAAGASAAVVPASAPAEKIPSGLPVLRVADTRRALLALARAHRDRFSLPVLGVTGSVGKTSTRGLLHAILSAAGPTVQTRGNYNNEVGLPLSLFALDEFVRFGVFEAGVSHPGDMPPLAEAMHPTAAVFSTLGESHLLAFGTREAIAREKGLLARDLPADGFLVFGADDPLEALYASSAPASARRVRVSFAGAPDADWQARLDGDTLLLSHAASGTDLRLPVPSPAAIQSRNLARAAAAAWELGIPADAIARGAAAFSAEPGRWQKLSTPSGLKVIHDAYNASPTSFASALSALAREAPASSSAVVAGPMLELGPGEESGHRAIGKALASGGYKAVVVLSREGVPFAEDAAANLLAAAFPADAENLLATGNPRAAGAFLASRLAPGDTVLLKASRGVRAERILPHLP
jgi:UDP-N-acetylmuramoyl-tripeptide--D-alanyl-D-alanine ligase